MSIVSTINQIDTQAATYAPAAIVGIQAAEAAGLATGATGQQKAQAVLDGILAGARVAEGVPVPQVAAIAGLIDLCVSIFNALGVFNHHTATPVRQAPAQIVPPSGVIPALK
jgi:hypothetical protein